MNDSSDAPSAAGGTRSGSLHVSWTRIGVAAAVLGALWLFDAFVLRTDMLASIDGRTPTTPYYAVFWPRVHAAAIAFVIAAVVFVRLVPRLCDAQRTRERTFGLALFACAALLPFALFLVRDDPWRLGMQFTYYRDEEFFQDAQKIGDVGAFLRHYVELMPTLSLHGQHFPPGHATLLYFVRRMLGPSELAAGLGVLIVAALGVVCAWRALREVVSDVAARQGACLLVAVPSLLDFTCVSMDAVFFAIAACTWSLALRAARTGRARDALLTGTLLFVATFFSFSALPLGLAIGLHALVAGRRRGSLALRRLVVIGATWLSCEIVTYLATGFSISACFVRGHELAREFMARVGSTRHHNGWLNLSYGNVVAFAIGAGAALIATLAVSLRERRVQLSAWTIATFATLALLALGGMHWMETERIWLYAMPWLCAIAVMQRPLDPRSLQRILACSCAQALIMEITLYTLW